MGIVKIYPKFYWNQERTGTNRTVGTPSGELVPLQFTAKEGNRVKLDAMVVVRLRLAEVETASRYRIRLALFKEGVANELTQATILQYSEGFETESLDRFVTKSLAITWVDEPDAGPVEYYLEVNVDEDVNIESTYRIFERALNAIVFPEALV